MKRKTCPFCGSTNLSVEELYPAWGGSIKEAHVVCDECACSAPVYVWDSEAASRQPTTGGQTARTSQLND